MFSRKSLWFLRHTDWEIRNAYTHKYKYDEKYEANVRVSKTNFTTTTPKSHLHHAAGERKIKE